MSARRLWGHPSEQFAIRVVFSLHSSHQFVELRHVSDTSRKGKAKSLSPSPCYLPLLWVGKSVDCSYSPPKTPPSQPPCHCVGPRTADLPSTHLLPPIWLLPTVCLFIGLLRQLMLVHFGVVCSLWY